MSEGAIDSTSDAVSVNRWIILIVVMAGTFMSILDSIVMNVALPFIMTSFGSDIEQAKWVSTGFMIAAVVSMPLTHWLGRRIGYGNLYIYALGIFTVGAAFSSLAWSMDSLIVARVVQGVGAGCVQPTSVAIITRTFPPQIRGRAFGIWSIGVMTAPSLGPTTGGLLIEISTWRSIFTLSAFVGIAALVLAITVLSRDREEDPAPFDFKGYFTLTTFLVAGLISVSYGQTAGWTSGWILFGFALSAASFMLFLAVEMDAEHPIVPLHLFRIPDFGLTLYHTCYKSLSRVGGGFLLPLFLHQVQRRDSLALGLMTMPGAVVMALSSPIAGILTDRFGGRWPAFIGGLLLAYYMWAFHELDALSSTWAIIWPQLPRGLGLALIDTPVVTTGMNSLAREDVGNGSWLNNIVQRASAALSISLLSTLLYRQVIIHKDNLGRGDLVNSPPSSEMLDRASQMGFSTLNRGQVVRATYSGEIGRAATTLAFQNIFLICSVIMLTSTIPALLFNRFAAPARPGDDG